MLGEFAPRFLLEAAFLILLGVGAGIADLRTIVIVAVLAGGWLLVSLIELTVWRAQARPIASYVPPPQAAAEDEVQEDTAEAEPPPDAGPESEAEEIAYPLRADAGSSPSEEVEAYTRVLGGEPADEAPGEHTG